MWKEWEMKNLHKGSRCPESERKKEVRKAENALGGMCYEIWREWEENGEQQKIEVGDWRQRVQ